MNIYKVKWSVPVPDSKTYITVDLEQSFKRKRDAVTFKNDLLGCYEFIGFSDANTYVRLITEEII